jgi:hypothetical protein
MKIRTCYITALLASGAAALAIAAAPTALAASTTQSCSVTGAGSECQSPGNVQIDDTPSAMNFDPYGGYGLALGGFGDPGSFRGGFPGGFGGGGHGGGHGGR